MSDSEPDAIVPLGPWDQSRRRAVRRADPGTLLAEPKAVATLSELEACHAVKALGVEDAVPLLARFTPDQARALLDLEVWRGARLQPADLLSWLFGFREAGIEPLAEAVKAWDPEAMAAFLGRRLLVAWKPTDDTPPHEIPEWLRRGDDELELLTTPDDRFLVAARIDDPDSGEPIDDDEREGAIRLVADLYRAEDWEHVAGLLRMAQSDDRFDLEETALQFRTARLEDLGFPPPERAEEIYRVSDLERGPRSPPSDRAPMRTDVPLVSAYVPESDDGLFFRALRRISDPRVVARIESEIVPLANAVLVADRAPWSDPEAIRTAVAEALGFVQVGLGPEDDLDGAAARLEQQALRSLFGAGYARVARVAHRLRRLSSQGVFRMADDPWGLLEPPDRDAAEALAAPAPRFPLGLEPWRTPGGRSEPLDLAGFGERRPWRSVVEVEAAEALAEHLEGWARVDGALELSTGIQRLEEPVLPPEPRDRTLRTALSTALAQAWLGGDFRVAPLDRAELEELASRAVEGGGFAGQASVLSALSARLEGAAARAAEREAAWGLDRAAATLAPFAASGRPDPRFIEGLFVREPSP